MPLPKDGEELIRALDQIRLTGIAELEAAHTETLPEVVYHYGSSAIVENVLKNKCVWATEGSFLNDTSELRYAGTLICEFLEQSKDWEMRKNFRPRIERAMRNERENSKTLSFVSSFSAEPDLLSQWRAYADNGAGVAMGFDLRQLAASNELLGDDLSTVLVRPCLYANNREAINLIVAPQVELALAYFQYKNTAAAYQEALDALETSLVITATLLGLVQKNSGFHEEREWRVVVMNKGNKVPPAVKFRNTRFGPAPYVEIPIAPSQLRRLGVGPRCERAAARSFRIMLDRFGCNTEIYHSVVSYR